MYINIYVYLCISIYIYIYIYGDFCLKTTLPFLPPLPKISFSSW